MKKSKKLLAAVTAVSVAATMISCGAPTIGKGSSIAITIDGYEVPAGVFIFYTINSYYEAYSIVSENNTGSTIKVDDVKKSHIDNIDAADWIQNKATEYCESYVVIEKEFEKLDIELTSEELDEIEGNLAQFSAYPIYSENGIGESSIRALLENEYKSNYVFENYYGFEGEKGMSEEELKDYFDENFARVKYFSLSLLDGEGNELDEDGKKEIKERAEKYAKDINSKSKIMDKLFEIDAAEEDYNTYVEEQKAATDTATTTTTTTTTTSSTETTTTTTDPYAKEILLPKRTTTTPDKSDSNKPKTTTTTTESESTKSLNKLNDFVFNELELNKAEVFDDGINKLYVVIRADLRERMTEDGYWTEDYIKGLQQTEYKDDYEDLIEEIASKMTIDKNKSAYRRYAPFKLELEVSAEE